MKPSTIYYLSVSFLHKWKFTKMVLSFHSDIILKLYGYVTLANFWAPCLMISTALWQLWDKLHKTIARGVTLHQTTLPELK